MTYENMADTALDYYPCRYGNSKLIFRGPKRRLEDNFVAFLGGIETYGRFVETPFPTLVEYELGLKALNLGCANAGVDAYLTDQSLLHICTRARATVIQVMGAQNMSNRYYAVHPRRNDRFLRASSALKSLYSDVDFTDFHFTRHMLGTLAEHDADKFKLIEGELKSVWQARMSTMIDRIGGDIILLWLADRTPDMHNGLTVYDKEPLFVDRDMVENLTGSVAKVIKVVAEPHERAAGHEELVYGQLERPAANAVLGPVVHRRAAEALTGALKQLCDQP